MTQTHSCPAGPRLFITLCSSALFCLDGVDVQSVPVRYDSVRLRGYFQRSGSTPDNADANVVYFAHQLNAIATVWMLISYP